MTNSKKKKSKALRYTLLGLLFTVGTAVIILAILLVVNLFFSPKMNAKEFSKNLSDFRILYEDSRDGRDMPRALEVTGSTVKISEDKKSYTYNLTVKNTASTEQSLALQVYCNENYVEAYGDRIPNPIISIPSDLPELLAGGAEKSFTFTGVIFGSGDDAVEQLKKNFEFVYFEVLYSTHMGRVMIPVSIIES